MEFRAACHPRPHGLIAVLAILLALGAAVGWGVSDFLGGSKSRTVPVLSVLMISQIAALVVLGAVTAVRGVGLADPSVFGFAAAAGAAETVAVATTDLPGIAVIGVLIVSADALYATATTLGMVGVVSVLGALHTLVTIAMARMFLGERLGRPQQAGVATALVGVLAISAG
ncbi:EamA family transporter [Nocardia sp. GCM10030253]|uniref:EamA family transporter n=1 Tax=Nocardia sp. GCM10030253 TaxID=3273404 RepID=UPI00363812D6